MRVLSGTGVRSLGGEPHSDVDHVGRVAMVGLSGVIQQGAGSCAYPLHNVTGTRARRFNSPAFFRNSLMTCGD